MNQRTREARAKALQDKPLNNERINAYYNTQALHILLQAARTKRHQVHHFEHPTLRFITDPPLSNHSESVQKMEENLLIELRKRSLHQYADHTIVPAKPAEVTAEGK